jgi:3-O-methylgallate 3,4-dioxygenase
MAELIGCLAMSHAPQLMVNPDDWKLLKSLPNNPSNVLAVRPELVGESLEAKWTKWNRCMTAIAALRRKLEDWQPDVVLVISDDQHETLLDDAMPPFTMFVGGTAEASVSLRYYKQPKSENRSSYQVDSELAGTLLDSLMEQGFDVAYSKHLRYEGGLGHGFARILKFLTPRSEVATIPLMVNTFYPPSPSARRCVALGRALAAAIRHAPGKQRVVVVGSGGLSHTVVDETLDRGVLQAIQSNDLDFLAAIPPAPGEGTSEILNWVVTAACADAKAELVDYVPCYRTDTGVGCGMGFAYWNLGGAS